MRVLTEALLMGLAFFAGAQEGLADAPVGYSIADAKVTLLSEGTHGSKLYSLDVDALGPGTAFVLDNYGASRYELGYDMGLLIGDKMLASLNALLGWMTQGSTSLKFLLEKLLVWQWKRRRPLHGSTSTPGATHRTL